MRIKRDLAVRDLDSIRVEIEDMFDDIPREVLPELAEAIQEIMFARAPKDTQQLADSISYTLWDTGFEVGPTVPYAEFVAGGTNPSFGRFVNAEYASILGYKKGFRLTQPGFKQGIHPGTNPNTFLDDTFEEIQLLIDDIMNRTIGR